MQIPADNPPPPSAAPALENLKDTVPPITAEQREEDFHKVFRWREKEITFSIAAEFYYRTMRMHTNAPPLSSYDTLADFAPEAALILYCASLNAPQTRVLRGMPAEEQIKRLDQWVEKNILINELDAAAAIANEMQVLIHRARAQPMETGEGGIDGMGN